MRNKVLEIIANILEITVEDVEKGIDEKEIWDSLTRVEIFFAIEEELGVFLSDKDLGIIDTPHKLIDIVEGKKSEA